MKRRDINCSLGRLTWSNPQRRKTTSQYRTSPKPHSKKVGRWRVEVRGRTVVCAGAKHAYKTPAAACAAYKRITSIKSVEGFVHRYGKKATRKVVVRSKTKKTKKAKKTQKRRVKKRAGRNAPVTAAEAAVIRRVLKKHGF